MKKDKDTENKIKELLKKYQETSEEYLSNWKKERANFLNYKNEEKDRKAELIKYANQEIVLKFISILDNLSIAEEKIPENLENDKSIEGFLRIKTQILDVLKDEGLEEIESLGKDFDPNFHEAVELVEEQNQNSGTIAEEIKKGYIFNNRVIRPAKVKVVK
ncbi:MAG: nucleotide exchange factor GrpE [Patescibacteria group bacterium]|nr:nucleotide exchange factor GrpE [Patescibacteria group bacterium]